MYYHLIWSLHFFSPRWKIVVKKCSEIMTIKLVCDVIRITAVWSGEGCTSKSFLMKKRNKTQLWAFRSLLCLAQRRFSAVWIDCFRTESDADVICVGFLCWCLPCISPALHCSRFVCKALKASCSHAMRSLLIKELLQHMGRDISSHACQTYWILSFFISVNNKPRQTQIQLHQRGEVKCEEMVCVSTQVDMRTGVWGLY